MFRWAVQAQVYLLEWLRIKWMRKILPQKTAISLFLFSWTANLNIIQLAKVLPAPTPKKSRSFLPLPAQRFSSLQVRTCNLYVPLRMEWMGKILLILWHLIWVYTVAQACLSQYLGTLEMEFCSWLHGFCAVYSSVFQYHSSVVSIWQIILKGM